VLFVPLAWAQDAFLARWETLRASQPAGVEFRIAAPKATFYLGETIPLAFSFTATNPRSFVADSRLQDRVGRMNYTEEFVPDPVATTEDPLRGLQGESGGMGGLSGGNAILSSERPFTVERILNEWVRFRAPGRYRIYVLSRRVRQVTGTGHTDQELQMFVASKPVEVVSNVITLEIAAASPEWVSEQITAATAVLDNTTGNDSESGRVRQRAGLTLRFLNTVESGTALAKRLPGVNSVDAFALHSGILDSSHRTELLLVMEQLLAEPGQAISERFLTTLAQLAVLVESGGVMPPYPSDEATRQAWQVESQRRAALVAEKRDHYVSVLVQKLQDKKAEVRALTRDALLSVAEAAQIRPPWLTGIVDSLIADFRALPAQMQSSLLDSRWHLLRNRDVLPLLNDLYANPPQPPVGYPSIRELVLLRIYELAPDRGRPLILAELHRPDGPRLGEKTLMMMPDENLPELNDVFSAQAARGGPLPTLLITRYGTSEIVKNVEAGYVAFNAELDRQKLPHCPFPLVFYFLKFDPEFGERELRKAFATGPCYDIGRAFDPLGSYAMSPALERIAIEHLGSGIVPIKRGAAEVLGKYGSPASQQPLWETMEYFRSWWKDREDDLRKPVGQEGVFLERALRTALAQGSGWLLGETELRRLLALCSSEECRASVQEWIQSAASPKPVEISSYPGDVRIKVAQYMVTGERELSAKLAQFPAGTTFRMTATRSEEANLERTRVEAAIRAAGHRIVP
jgi:hypothetical protein